MSTATGSARWSAATRSTWHNPRPTLNTKTIRGSELGSRGSTIMSDLSDALRDLDLGPIVPLLPGTKKPAAGHGWPSKVLRMPDEVRAWWGRTSDANHGILCERLAVLDVDVKNPDLDGTSSLKELAARGLGTPATRLVETT